MEMRYTIFAAPSPKNCSSVFSGRIGTVENVIWDDEGFLVWSSLVDDENEDEDDETR